MRGHAADALGLEVLVRDTLKATSSKTKPLLFGILHGALRSRVAEAGGSTRQPPASPGKNNTLLWKCRLPEIPRRLRRGDAGLRFGGDGAAHKTKQTNSLTSKPRFPESACHPWKTRTSRHRSRRNWECFWVEACGLGSRHKTTFVSIIPRLPSSESLLAHGLGPDGPPLSLVNELITAGDEGCLNGVLSIFQQKTPNKLKSN